MPGATSGLASRAWITASPRSRIRCRIRANPSAAQAAMTTATMRTLRLYSMALTIASSSNSAVYHLVVKPAKGSVWSLLSLTENSAVMIIGA